jgi:hypothetical protein
MQSNLRLIHNFRKLHAHHSPLGLGRCIWWGYAAVRSIGETWDRLVVTFQLHFQFELFAKLPYKLTFRAPTTLDTTRNNGISRNSSWRSRRRLRWTWWIFCAWRYVARSELYRISQLMRNRTRRNGSFFRTPRHCYWYVEHLFRKRL